MADENSEKTAIKGESEKHEKMDKKPVSINATSRMTRANNDKNIGEMTMRMKVTGEQAAMPGEFSTKSTVQLRRSFNVLLVWYGNIFWGATGAR